MLYLSLYLSGSAGYLLEDKEQGKLKFDVIMEQLVVEMKKYPGYKLYVTGHRYVIFFCSES